MNFLCAKAMEAFKKDADTYNKTKLRHVKSSKQ